MCAAKMLCTQFSVHVPLLQNHFHIGARVHSESKINILIQFFPVYQEAHGYAANRYLVGIRRSISDQLAFPCGKFTLSLHTDIGVSRSLLQHTKRTAHNRYLAFVEGFPRIP